MVLIYVFQTIFNLETGSKIISNIKKLFVASPDPNKRNGFHWVREIWFHCMCMMFKKWIRKGGVFSLTDDWLGWNIFDWSWLPIGLLWDTRYALYKNGLKTRLFDTCFDNIFFIKRTGTLNPDVIPRDLNSALKWSDREIRVEIAGIMQSNIIATKW